MKILFICGCLEPGKDGVGDYTRRLCAELLRENVAVGILAFNDRFIEGALENKQKYEELTISTLRLSMNLTNAVRLKKAKTWINYKNPEWISLQFVPYSFHKKGLPFQLGTQLKNIGVDRNWHIMFHELWIGIKAESNYKEQLVGYFQKLVVKKMLLTLKPNVIHTQTGLYKIQLEKLGFDVNLLPLFSNIPVVASKKDIVEREDLNKSGINLVVFGSIFPNSHFEEFAKEIKVYSDHKEKRVFIAFIGRCGQEQDQWTKTCESLCLDYQVYGEQDEGTISKLLRRSDIALNTTPIQLIEKSGTASAALAHGCSVICLSSTWSLKKELELKAPLGIYEYQIGKIDKCMSHALGVKDMVFHSAKDVANLLVLNLNNKKK